jgi:hypothetical protein
MVSGTGSSGGRVGTLSPFLNKSSVPPPNSDYTMQSLSPNFTMRIAQDRKRNGIIFG